jgi:hypothetical protein
MTDAHAFLLRDLLGPHAPPAAGTALAKIHRLDTVKSKLIKAIRPRPEPAPFRATELDPDQCYFNPVWAVDD